MTRWLAIFAGAMVLAPTLPAVAEVERPPLFEQDVLPVLTAKCGKCHGSQMRKGDLDLSSMQSLAAGGESGESLVAKSLDDSYLWTMIADGEMPPEGERQLTPAERAIIRRWLETGARSEAVVRPSERPLNQHDVIPIVLLRCATCHGARLRRGGLDMRTPASMLRGGSSGPALVPGDPDASRMIQRIESQACPPRELLLKFFVRRPPASEVKLLRGWIAAGAPQVDVKPDVATKQPDPLVSNEDRRHWAFQPLGASPTGDSVDDFIRVKLRERGLDFSSAAGRETLIRRAYLDLIGLPPGPGEARKWREHRGDDWYSQMIDQLLASPRYGERWGRYWLDLAGYADSEGGVSADPLRAVAWKYRDYVIRSFNDDKPYDRFLIEQLAGDELTDYERADEMTPEMVEQLVATGFLRMGIDQTGSRTMNFVPERLGVISDTITIVGEGLMGLTLGCARCHSHKYDPIPHRDYYRFKAIFQGALDEHDWLTFKTRVLKVDTPQRQAQVAKVNPPLLRQVKTLTAKRKRAVTALHLELLRQHYPDQSQADREATIRALKIADNNRSQPQRILVEMLQQVEVLPDDDQPRSVVAARQAINRLDDEMVAVKRRLEPSLAIRALWDRGDPSPTYILRRGEYQKPGRLVGPGVPAVLTDGATPFRVKPPFPNGTPKTGRRLAFARWLTRPDHPLTARVMVNRIWYHHFGNGLVPSLENFGTKGQRPSHPELLDWLAIRFVQSGWRIKEVHRLIMNSRTYRQSSRITADARQRDPQNRWLSRMPLRRMDAEAVRDSLLRVSGRLDDRPGGPPDPVRVARDGLVSARPTAGGRWRRSVYLQYRRTEIPTLLETFDYPEMGPNCLTRSTSLVSHQPLMLMNNGRIRELAAAFAGRVESRLAQFDNNDTEPPSREPAAQVEAVYELALSRSPTARERQLGVRALKQLRTAWNNDARAALETYCHTILNSAAFLYID